MSRTNHGSLATRAALLSGVLAWCLAAFPSQATELRLKDGRILHGKLGLVDSLTESPRSPEETGNITRIVFLNDELRRTFVPERQVLQTLDDPEQIVERFTIFQKVQSGGQGVRGVGARITGTEFDQWDKHGRRIFKFATAQGSIDVVQGITLITPQWTKVEGLNYVWDMRIATSSIPAEILNQILLKEIDPKNPDHRKKVARFYLQSERYKDARAALESILEDFPDDPDLEEQLAGTIRTIRQMEAQQALTELEARREAGQHRLVMDLLKVFPSEGVAGEILQEIREMSQEYSAIDAKGREAIQRFDAELAKVQDATARKLLKPIREELGNELGIDTFDRMAAFRQNLDDPALTPEQRLAFAVSGWLVGADDAVNKLPVAVSLYRVRDLIRQYINEPVKVNRDRILGQLRSEEGATPNLVAALLSKMKPAVEPPQLVSEEQPGFFDVAISAVPGQPDAHYLVQLPPEYDPYRLYPTIVTLNGAATTPSQQIDWWAGGWTDDGWRAGQGSRHGYIVIAPVWTTEHQVRYGYSAREHAIVLGSLRDACRRFAIDTDRVFLSGHSMGGDAAWDMGLAHPDLWAGVIPIVAKSDRFCAHYSENAERLPFYVVCGELDGKKLTDNARDLDRYLQRGLNCTVVEYLGRGHEHFYEEILRIYDWMGRLRRDFFPREFECSTMRPWDNFFWWVEVEGLPPKTMVDPASWPPPRGTRPAEVSARLTDANGLTVTAGAERVTVWLSPKMVNFEQRVNVVVNTRRVNTADRFIAADLETLLEDVRTRGDRQHPFWAKIETPTGRVFTDR